METKFISVAAAAARWGVTHQCVLGWIRKGALPGFKLGKRNRLRISDVEEFESRSALDAAKTLETAG